MKTILVATDFSPASRDATAYAAWLANGLHAGIHLVHVYNELLPVAPVPEAPTVVAVSLRREKEARLGQEIEWLGTLYPIKVDGTVINGFKGDVIRGKAEELGVDLIVMGRKNGRERFFGSTVNRMIRKTNVPVLVIPEGFDARRLKHFVMAVDFSEMILHSDLAPLLDLVKKFDGALQVLHVEESGKQIGSQVAEKLQLAKALWAFNYIYERVEYDNVDIGILDYANVHPVDLLVMIAHRHSIFERLLGAVHTPIISAQVRMPLLILKAE